jgi:hypothetical protein
VTGKCYLKRKEEEIQSVSCGKKVDANF